MKEKTLAVEMKGISKSFGAIKAVRDVSIELMYGEVTGLVGDNAAGKSTLMHILSGLYRPDKGDIYIDGKKVNIRNPRDARELGIEMIYQDLALSPFLNISNNIFLGREITRGFILSEKEMKEQSWAILNRLGGFGFDLDSLKREALYFSGGQQQAIAVARAFLFKPKILIMDEPTASIGIKGVKILHKFLLWFKKEKTSIVYITHRLPDVSSVSDRIMVMREGRIVDISKTKDTTIERTIRLMIGIE